MSVVTLSIFWLLQNTWFWHVLALDPFIHPVLATPRQGTGLSSRRFNMSMSYAATLCKTAAIVSLSVYHHLHLDLYVYIYMYIDMYTHHILPYGKLYNIAIENRLICPRFTHEKMWFCIALLVYHSEMQSHDLCPAPSDKWRHVSSSRRDSQSPKELQIPTSVSG